MPARKREPDLLAVDKLVPLIGRDRATVFRWFRQRKLTRHFVHDFAAGARKAAVDMHEVRERMPELLPAEKRGDG